ncbi:MAG TPA: hypothetical protein VF660_08925 [Actinomycetota bacterium]|jgi:DNA-binding beta-propeller fold protein YncE
MNDLRDVLERKRQLESHPDRGAFDRLLHLRTRRRRNERLGALATALALLGGVAWAASSLGHLSSSTPKPVWPIDRSKTGVVRTLKLQTGSSTTLAALAGSVWVGQNAVPELTRIDPRTGRTLATIRTHGLPPHGTEGHALISDVVGAFDSIWTVDEGFGTVTRIDPRTNKIVARIRVGGNPTDAAEAAGSLWVLKPLDGRVYEINPLTNTVVARRKLLASGEHGDIAGDRDGIVVRVGGRIVVIWANRSDPSGRAPIPNGDNAVALGANALVADKRAGVVSEFDRGTCRLRRRFRVGTAPGALIVSHGVVWVADARDPILTAIDEATNHALLTLPIGRGVAELAVSGSSLWVLNKVDNSLTVVHVE